MTLKPNGNVLGPRLGSDVQKVFVAAKEGSWTSLEGNRVEIAGHILESHEYDMALEPSDPATTASLKSNDAVVILDTKVTPELEAEGSARDLIRTIQQARKEADLEVTERITVEVSWSPKDIDAIKKHEPAVMAAVLANQISWLPGNDEPMVLLAKS